ncbi:MAG: 50S ribosomal protein L30 [Firmicutes bacterium]|nr:50S ribosomal protein L30 [Bacillota bacterium]
MQQLQIKLVRSLIGRTEAQRRTVLSLGLRKIGHSVVREDNPSVRGMIDKVSHMVEVSVVQS